jgi:RNA polymerase sigma-70 factor (ECF subfamily)
MDEDSTAPTSQSLEDLFLAEEARMLRFAVRLAGDFATAQDLVQDAFLRLLQQRSAIASPRAWLFTTLRHLALNHRRNNARFTALDIGAESRPDADATHPGLGLEHDERVLLLQLCLEELPPADRLLAKLKFEEDLSYLEISRRTGLSTGNVGYRLHGIVKKITHALRHAAAADAAA